jgi:hypothetical protein
MSACTGGGCNMSCSDEGACHLKQCGGGCTMDCNGSLCDLEQCGAGCSISCWQGRTCHIGECTDGGCSIKPYDGPLPQATGPATEIIDDCSGGYCTIDCTSGDTCTIQACAGGNCTINCPNDATCTCGDSGCMVVSK